MTRYAGRPEPIPVKPRQALFYCKYVIVRASGEKPGEVWGTKFEPHMWISRAKAEEVCDGLNARHDSDPDTYRDTFRVGVIDYDGTLSGAD